MLTKRAAARAAATERVDVASRVEPFIRGIFAVAETEEVESPARPRAGNAAQRGSADPSRRP